MKDRKNRKLLILSILVVLISSWVVGNLMNLGGNVDTQPLFEVSGGGSTLMILPWFLIVVPILYSTYVLYDKDKISMLTGLMLLGFWILFHLAAVFLIAYPVAVISERADYSLSPALSFSTPPFFPNIGFLLLFLLTGSLLTYVLYLKIPNRNETSAEKKPSKPLNEINIKAEKDDEKMEESLSSTLNKAIDELHEGENVRSTIIRCYREMSHILEVTGAQNDDFKTPREFKDETIKKIPVQKDVISDITYLFEEARYSPHKLGQDKRDRALQHLKSLKEGLL